MIYDSIVTLGAATPPNAQGAPEAWGAYLAALRDEIVASKTGAIAAYNTLKQVRSNLGLPFMGGATGEGNADLGAWSADYDQQVVDLIAMSKVFVDATNDALAGKRKLSWDDQVKDYAIEGFTSDPLRLQYGPGSQPVLVDSGGNEAHVTGQVGNPVVFGVIAGLAVVQSVGIGFLVYKAFQTAQVLAQQKTERTVAEATKKHADLVASGKITAAEAEGLNKSIYAGATDLRKATTEPDAKKTSDITSAVKTVMWVGLGLGTLYVVAQAIGKMPAMPALAGARDNPDYTKERVFYLPKEVRDVPPLTPSGTDLEVWTWETEGSSAKKGPYTMYHGIAFAGKAGKPLWHHWFATPASRLKMITDSIASRKAHSVRTEKSRTARREYKHTLKVGDIVSSSWGYEQTQVDFYEVIDVKEKSVVICKIGQSIDRTTSSGSMDYVVPVPGKCYGKPMTKRVGEGGYIRLTSYSSAHLWDGKPEYSTASGWGH